MGITAPGTADRIRALISKTSLPTDIPVDEEQFLGASLDKKASGSSISVILAETIGSCKTVKIPVAEFCDMCKAVWNA